MRAIVVGGTRGIGRDIYEVLWAHGHRVVPMAREIGETPPGHEHGVQLDLRWDDEDIRAATSIAVAALGGLDALVLSGGMGAYLSPVEMTRPRLEDLFQVNVIGPISCYRATLRYLLKSRGRILFLGSTISRRPGASGLSAYASTKGAIESFVISEARRLAKHGVKMNVLSPGWVDTPMTAGLKEKLRARIIRAIPVGRMGSSREVADFARAVLEAGDYLTGQVLEMSGGA